MPLIRGFDHLAELCTSFALWYNEWRPHMTLGGFRPADCTVGTCLSLSRTPRSSPRHRASPSSQRRGLLASAYAKPRRPPAASAQVDSARGIAAHANVSKPRDPAYCDIHGDSRGSAQPECVDFDAA